MEQVEPSTAIGRTTNSDVGVMKGAVLGMILHDVCEEIRLEELRQILGAQAG